MRFSSTLTRGVALAGALALCPASTAFAAGSGQGESTPLQLGTSTVHHASSSGGSSILRTIIALVIVVAVIYAVARILRAVKGRDQPRAAGDGLQRISTLPLGTGKSLALVRSGTDIVLVGVAESGVTPIKTYTEAEALANGIALPRESDADDQAAGSPVRWLDGLRKLTVRE